MNRILLIILVLYIVLKIKAAKAEKFCVKCSGELKNFRKDCHTVVCKGEDPEGKCYGCPDQYRARKVDDRLRCWKCFNEGCTTGLYHRVKCNEGFQKGACVGEDCSGIEKTDKKCWTCFLSPPRFCQMVHCETTHEVGACYEHCSYGVPQHFNPIVSRKIKRARFGFSVSSSNETMKKRHRFITEKPFKHLYLSKSRESNPTEGESSGMLKGNSQNSSEITALQSQNTVINSTNKSPKSESTIDKLSEKGGVKKTPKMISGDCYRCPNTKNVTDPRINEDCGLISCFRRNIRPELNDKCFKSHKKVPCGVDCIVCNRGIENGCSFVPCLPGDSQHTCYGVCSTFNYF